MRFEKIQYVNEIDAACVTDSCREMLSDGDRIFGLKCIRHDAVIAQAVFSLGDGQGETARLESVFVPEKYRRMKLGSEVVLKAEAILSENGIKGIEAKASGEYGELSEAFLPGIGFTESEGGNMTVRCRLGDIDSEAFLDEEDDDDVWEFLGNSDRRLAIACTELEMKEFFVDRKKLSPKYTFIYVRDNEVVGAMLGHLESEESLVIDRCFFDGIDPLAGVSVLLGYEINSAKENLEDNAIITVNFEKREYNEVAFRCFGEACTVEKVKIFSRSIGDGGNDEHLC